MHYTSESGDTERAPYALPPGTSALQSDMGGVARLLAIAALAFLVSAVPVSFLVGRLTSPEAQLQRKLEADLPELERVWARTVALGPIQDLIDGYVTYLAIVEMNSDDPTIWFGVERLAREGLLARTDSMRLLRDRVLFTLRKFTPPDNYGQLFRRESLIAGG